MINAMGTPPCTFKKLWDNVIYSCSTKTIDFTPYNHNNSLLPFAESFFLQFVWLRPSWAISLLVSVEEVGTNLSLEYSAFDTTKAV